MAPAPSEAEEAELLKAAMIIESRFRSQKTRDDLEYQHAWASYIQTIWLHRHPREPAAAAAAPASYANLFADTCARCMSLASTAPTGAPMPASSTLDKILQMPKMLVSVANDMLEEQRIKAAAGAATR